MTITQDNLCAVVVWYNPTAENVTPIAFYAQHVKQVYVVDNSTYDNSHLLATQPFTNLIYLPQLQNTGIAHALNVGCQSAIAAGCQWILTMDQDSKFDNTPFTTYLHEANHYIQEHPNTDIGLFAPFADCDGEIEKHHRKGRYEPRLVVMASGNIVSVENYLLANGFRDEFFIDLVDDELCCHLHRLNKAVLRLNNIILNHQLGEGAKPLLFKKTYIAHAPWRYFYIARNLRYMIQMYPEYQRFFKRQQQKYLKRLFLYDWSQKCAKLQAFARGWQAGSSLPSSLGE